MNYFKISIFKKYNFLSFSKNFLKTYIILLFIIFYFMHNNIHKKISYFLLKKIQN